MGLTFNETNQWGRINWLTFNERKGAEKHQAAPFLSLKVSPTVELLYGYRDFDDIAPFYYTRSGKVPVVYLGKLSRLQLRVDWEDSALPQSTAPDGLVPRLRPSA